jgi:hypothetical protein
VISGYEFSQIINIKNTYFIVIKFALN